MVSLLRLKRTDMLDGGGRRPLQLRLVRVTLPLCKPSFLLVQRSASDATWERRRTIGLLNEGTHSRYCEDGQC